MTLTPEEQEPGERSSRDTGIISDSEGKQSKWLTSGDLRPAGNRIKQHLFCHFFALSTQTKISTYLESLASKLTKLGGVCAELLECTEFTSSH